MSFRAGGCPMGDARDTAGPRPKRRRRRLPGAHRPLPAGARAALLPDPGLAPGRRGPPPGDAASRLARARPVRGKGLRALLAIPHRDESLPELPARRGPAAEATGATARRAGLAAALSRRAAR